IAQKVLSGLPSLQAQMAKTLQQSQMDRDRLLDSIRKAVPGNSEMMAKFAKTLRSATGAPFEFPGSAAFKLYDTYGLPRDFIRDTLRDQEVVLDEAGFERAMAEQQARSKASWKGVHKEAASPVYRKLADT